MREEAESYERLLHERTLNGEFFSGQQLHQMGASRMKFTAPDDSDQKGSFQQPAGGMVGLNEELHDASMDPKALIGIVFIIE